MMELEQIEQEWNLGAWWGHSHQMLTITQSTVIHTWIALCTLFFAILCMRFAMKTRLGKHVVCSMINFFMDLTTQSVGTFSFAHFSFVTSIFFYILFCNLIALVPGVEEPTKDLSTTLALGIITFLHRQWITIKLHGVKAYITEYFEPFFIMFPLNVVGKFASIVSVSFRLFGNIFGGSIITNLYFQAVEKSILLMVGLTGMHLIVMVFFTVFEGFLQAFVFTMLTLTYLSISIQGEGGH